MTGSFEMKSLLPVFFSQQTSSSMVALSSRWVYANNVPVNNLAEGGNSGRTGMVGEKVGWWTGEKLGLTLFFS